MREGVVANLVALSQNPLDNAGMRFRICPDDKEAGVDFLFFQDIQDCRRPLRVRPNRRRSMQPCAALPRPADDVSCRHFCIGFVINIAGLGVDLEIATAFGRIGLNP